MLVELIVENLAVVERIRVRFHPGFNVLTGETGSGKSIIVDALGLLFGGRASTEVIRAGSDRMRVAGIFEVHDSPDLRARLEPLGVALEEGELLIEREILSNGKSRAFLSSRPTTVSFLRELAPWLGDIHGQHDQQRLFEKSEQLALLDEFAAAQNLRQQVASIYGQWRAATEELEQLQRNEQERLRLADLWSYQLKEIETVQPKLGEDEALEQERRILQNAAKIEESASAAYGALYESPQAALAQVRAARKKVEELARIDARLEAFLDPLTSAEAQLEDVALGLRDYLARLESDPARLETVEARLAALDKLKRKYGPALEQVIAFSEATRRQLDSAENLEARQAECRARVDQLALQFEELADSLRALRKQAAQNLEQKVEAELALLAMKHTRFRVAFDKAAWSERGADAVQFLIAPNLGEEPKPLDRIASGGELSRVALALKTVITSGAQNPHFPARTLVFDEIDAGIGGHAAETVGRRLKALAAHQQVLCVTHLAQIAGFADHHYRVEKYEREGRTVARMEELTGSERTREIGRMLSGERLTPEALKHAEQLIQLGARA
ncbi:MAG: DNA repair protein RecN [Bryobacteraceae bacterium]|nr:DNA repair protein RecN [Bryobacteraceae bacterium]MDW8378683.1 DNA repair protein RecN [Bryobacterales bacterium]